MVPESESDVLTSADLVNRQQLVLCYMNDVKHQLQMHDLQSGHLLQKLPLEIGSISEISSRPEDADFFYSFTSFLTPGIIYRCDFTSGTPDLSVLKETKIANWDRSLFEIRQVQIYASILIFFSLSLSNFSYACCFFLLFSNSKMTYTIIAQPLNFDIWILILQILLIGVLLKIKLSQLKTRNSGLRFLT